VLSSIVIKNAMSEDLTPEPQGYEFLGELIDTVADGEPPSTQLMMTVHRFLNNLQAKVDLTQVGLVKYHMSRAKKLSKLIEMIEDQIIPPDVDVVALGEEERMELLKHFSKELQIAVEFITTKASKPTISSSDGMKSAAGEDVSTKKNFASQMSPERRQRIRNLAMALKARLLTKPEEGVVETEPKSET
jgi:hypothetical protein